MFRMFLAWAVTASASASVPALARAQEKPEGYRQVLPRGRLASIDAPTYVPASEATIRPSSWVLGVVIDGQPRAYSLNLLNAHEVVNDTLGATDFAAVW